MQRVHGVGNEIVASLFRIHCGNKYIFLKGYIGLWFFFVYKNIIGLAFRGVF